MRHDTKPHDIKKLPKWALRLKRQCAATNTPFFMKQMSGGKPIPDFLQGQEFPRSN